MLILKLPNRTRCRWNEKIGKLPSIDIDRTASSSGENKFLFLEFSTWTNLNDHSWNELFYRWKALRISRLKGIAKLLATIGKKKTLLNLTEGRKKYLYAKNLIWKSVSASASNRNYVQKFLCVQILKLWCLVFKAVIFCHI